MSFSDDSDLTDLSSSEDEGPLASASQKAKAKAVAPEYQVKNSLKPPRTTQYTAKSLYGTRFSTKCRRSIVYLELQTKSSRTQSILTLNTNGVSGDLPLYAPLVRADCTTEVVWPEHKMSGIIDSILRNYYVPPVIFGSCQPAFHVDVSHPAFQPCRIQTMDPNCGPVSTGSRD